MKLLLWLAPGLLLAQSHWSVPPEFRDGRLYAGRSADKGLRCRVRDRVER